MTDGLEIRPDALADIQKAARWYDEQQPGLGAEFVREVFEATDILLKLSRIAFATNERMCVGNYSTDFLTASYFERPTT